jgi:general secretion pathway protein M
MTASERSAFPAWWESRTPRERLLLAIMSVLIVASGFWFGIVAPVQRAEAAAAARHDRAVQRLMAVSASAQQVASLQAVRDGGPSGRVLTQAVVQTALANGVPVSRQTLDPSGGVAVAVDAVDPGSAFRWIASLQRDHGVSVSTLVLSRNPDRSLRLQVKFAGGRA